MDLLLRTDVRALAGATRPDDALLARRFLEVAEYVTRSHAKHVRGHYGLSSSRVKLLLLLSDSGARRLRPADLAERAGLSRATVTRLIDGLARDGLVARRADAEDGRAKRVELTAGGRRLLQRIAPRHARRLEALTRHLTEDDRRQLRRLLERLRAAMAALSGA
jgi:DNA-binding MarR family transcriptional regulator